MHTLRAHDRFRPPATARISRIQTSPVAAGHPAHGESRTASSRARPYERPGRISPVLPLTALAIAATSAAIWLPPFYQRRATVAALDAPEPQVRKTAAWAVAETRMAPAAEAIRRKLALRSEPNADVRESFVYALGHAGSQRDFDLLHDLALSDLSGYVRQAALLAAARVDPARCRRLLAPEPGRTDASAGTSQPGVSPDAWDALATAQASLALGDVAGVPALLDLARRADPSRRQVAARALYKWLRPALVAAGRWPLDREVRPGEIWPASLVDEVERRCREFDLQRLSDQTRAHERKSEPIRRNTARWTGARKRLVGMLFDHDGG